MSEFYHCNEILMYFLLYWLPIVIRLQFRFCQASYTAILILSSAILSLYWIIKYIIEIYRSIYWYKNVEFIGRSNNIFYQRSNNSACLKEEGIKSSREFDRFYALYIGIGVLLLFFFSTLYGLQIDNVIQCSWAGLLFPFYLISLLYAAYYGFIAYTAIKINKQKQNKTLSIPGLVGSVSWLCFVIMFSIKIADGSMSWAVAFIPLFIHDTAIVLSIVLNTANVNKMFKVKK